MQIKYYDATTGLKISNPIDFYLDLTMKDGLNAPATNELADCLFFNKLVLVESNFTEE